MKFNLSTTGYFYNNKEEIDSLKELGFSFEQHKQEYAISGNPTIEINTLEELVEFSKKHGHIILDGNNIEIYDNYRE